MPSLARIFRRAYVPFASAAALLLTACALAPTSPTSTTHTATPAGIRGIVHGGQQPVAYSQIQLWAVGTGGDGSSSTQLLTSNVYTAADGSFNITGLYTCPSATTLVYLTANGGEPIVTTSANNSALAMMAALGACGNLGASTYITMNEITTVGSVFALAPYITSYSAIGYGNDLSAITSAFNQVNEFVNIASGTAGGPSVPSGYGVDSSLINTLADIIATCVNTSGSLASGSACNSLFALTGGVTTLDTIAASLYIANNPSANLTNLLNLVSPTSPFQPLLTSAPNTFAITVQPKVATPTISPNGGLYTNAQTVTLADTTPNAVIHYTIDGTNPTANSPTYSSALAVSQPMTINAIGVLPGYLNSDLATATFTTSVPSGTISPVVNSYGIQTSPGGYYPGDGGQATLGTLHGPAGIALDSSGNLYIADFGNNAIRKVNAAGVISTVAGVLSQYGFSQYGFSGDGGEATNAELDAPEGVAADSLGNLYIADSYNNRIRKVTAAGVISTFAGNGTKGFGGDGGQATNAELNNPAGVGLDSIGNLYIADEGNNRIRKVASDGTISTVAGGGSSFPLYGGQATSAALKGPTGVAVDSVGNVYIADRGNNLVERLNADGTISLIAGGVGGCGVCSVYPVYGTSIGDGGQATYAELFEPTSLALDSSGNLYIAAYGDGSIRKVTAAGVISTVVTYDDNPQAVSATAIRFAMYFPAGLAIDSAGNLYFSDSGKNWVQKITF